MTEKQTSEPRSEGQTPNENPEVQPEGQTQTGEPAEQRQTEEKPKTLKDLLGENVPKHLKTFAEKPIEEAIKDIDKSMENAQRYITQLSQGIIPQEMREQMSYGQPYEGYQYPYQESGIPQERESIEEPDFYTDGEKFVEYKAHKIAEEKARELKEELEGIKSTIPVLALTAGESAKAKVREKYPDFKDLEPYIDQIMLREASDPRAFLDPKNWVLAYHAVRWDLENAGVLPKREEPPAVEGVKPPETEKPTSSAISGEEKPSVSQIEAMLGESTKNMLKAFWGKNKKKYEEKIMELWEETQKKGGRP